MGVDDDGGGTSYPLTESSNVLNQQNTNTSMPNPCVSPQSDVSQMDTNILPSPTSPRLKAYPPDSGGPFVVFFRSKGKRLNTIQISKGDDILKEKRSEVKCWRKEKRRGKNGMAYWERFRKSFNALRVFIDFVLRQQHAACDRRESAHGCSIRFLLLSHVPFASTEACKGDSVECIKFVKIISHQAGRAMTYCGSREGKKGEKRKESKLSQCKLYGKRAYLVY